jgi:hypothetical protein
MIDRLKSLLTRVGGYCSPRVVHRLNSVVNYLEVGRWFRTRGFRVGTPVRDRFQLFDRVTEQIGHERVAYLEFGVWMGDTMRWWSKRLAHPDSVLHGFDSFEGLPEQWNLESGQSAFSMDGKLPDIPDPRVKFFKGWFDDTLKGYVVPPHDVLFITLDADLYSSTRSVLTALEKDIHPGTYLYFDEFSDRMHEMRAFEEYIARTKAEFEVVGATLPLTHVVFRRVR